MAIMRKTDDANSPIAGRPSEAIDLHPTNGTSEPTFLPNKYFDVFAILGVRLVYTFDESLDYLTITQYFDVRKKRNSGPTGWCQRVDVRNQDYFIYRDETDRAIPARLIRDARDNFFVVAEDLANEKDAVISFSTQTRQRTHTLANEHHPRRRAYSLSRVYGSDIDRCEIEVRVPPNWRLTNSIPRLILRNGVFHLSTSASCLEAVSLAVSFKRRLFPSLSWVFRRNAHPATWALIPGLLSLLATILWATAKFFLRERGA